MAVKEARRYLSLLTKDKQQTTVPIPIYHTDNATTVQGLLQQHSELVFLFPRQHQPMQDVFRGWNASHPEAVAKLQHADAHSIHSLAPQPGVNAVACTGATAQAVLYCAYTLLEAMGVRFYLHGDVLPAAERTRSLPRGLHRTYSPRFSVRGLQPFHDFPMGPDWWQPQFWKAQCVRKHACGNSRYCSVHAIIEVGRLTC